MFRRFLAGILLGLSCCTLLAPAVFADDAEVAVAEGDLTITNPTIGAFGGVTLNGTKQTTNAGLGAFTVNDARGTGAGWHVTAEATQFLEWSGGYVSGGKTLDAGSLKMSQPDVAPDALTTSPAPDVSAGPYMLDEGGPVTIASAAEDTGMGKYDFSATTLTLTLTPSIYSKTYRSTITISVVSGP